MQCVLGVDLSSQPCEVTVSRMVGSVMQVVQRLSVELPLFSNQTALLKDDCVALLPNKEDLKEDIQPKHPGESEITNQDVDPDEPHSNLSAASVKDNVSRLRKALNEIQHSWTSAAVIIPPYDHVALNLNLPFGDSKALSRIVDMEVQDVVPFELDEFVVQHSVLGPLNSPSGLLPDEAPPSFDVHVALLPTHYLRNILSICSSAGLDPAILTVPSSANGAVFHLARDYFKENSALVYQRDGVYSITLFIDGQVRSEQVLRASSLLSQGSIPADPNTNPVFTALKLLIASAERRYSARINTVYLLGIVEQHNQLQQRLGRPVELILLSEVLKSEDPSVGISPLAAYFAQDELEIPTLSNFRTGQFSFRPRLFEFARALSTTWGSLLGSIAVIALAVGALYGVREFNLNKTRESLIRELKTVVPELPSDSEDLRSALSAAEIKLSEDLGVLSSPAKITPLDALSEITRLIPGDSGVKVLSLKISGTRATLTGTAPELSTIETLQKALRSNKNLFSKVTATPGAASVSGFNFNVELILAQ